MIIGQDFMKFIVMIIAFKNQVLRWDGNAFPMDGTTMESKHEQSHKNMYINKATEEVPVLHIVFGSKCIHRHFLKESV